MLEIWLMSNITIPARKRTIIKTEISEENTLDMPLLSIFSESGVMSIARNPEKVMTIKNSRPKYRMTPVSTMKNSSRLVLESSGFLNIVQ
jgi:hypothetical protein